MKSGVLFICLVALVAVGVVSDGSAQVPTSVGKASVVTETAVIEAIDSTNRLITFKLEDGMMETVVAGPEVQRFNELKVGDRVTFRFYESVAYAI